MNYQVLLDNQQDVRIKATISTLQADSGINRDAINAGPHVDFILCPLCFWCSSYFNIGKLSIVHCPNCYSKDVEQVPISDR